MKLRGIDYRCLVILTGVMFLLAFARPCLGQPEASHRAPLQIVLVEPDSVTAAAVSKWKSEGFKGMAVVLDERRNRAAYDQIVSVVGSDLDLYYWVEVGRSPELARAHPRWMASLGMHHDWMEKFPKAAEPGRNEVAKAYPWVPIGYREAFQAHLQRIEQLLPRAAGNWRGLLLNDLQGGPSSCGCGNLQCRWAIDYQVPTTASPSNEDDIAAQFVGEVRQRTKGKLVIPVWTTECEEADLPAAKHQGQPGTGLCGSVGCATGACPLVFTRQWSALVAEEDAPVGLLALPLAFGRTQKEFGGGPAWASAAISYVNRTPPANDGKAIRADRLWVVVENGTPDQQATARESATKAGVGAIVVARMTIEQGYEPRIVRVNE